ncbi:hypothetical protein ACFW04_014657 [Cataglyphis niger]
MVIFTEKTWMMKLNYLGIEASSDRNIIREVQTQADKANTISGYLKNIIWRNKYMITENLTYAAETCADTTKTKRILKSNEMKTLCTIQGISEST